MMNVESVNLDRQVITNGVVRREGIHRPVLARRGDLHRARYRQEMHGEIEVRKRDGAVSETEVERQVLIVIYRSTLYLQGLGDGHARRQEEAYRLRERLTVHRDPCAVGVGDRIDRQVELLTHGGTTGLERRVIHQRHFEDRAFVRHDSTLLIGVDREFGFAYPLRLIADDCSGIIESRFLFVLMRTVGRTGYGVEHIRAVEQIGLTTRDTHLVTRHSRGVAPNAVGASTIDSYGQVTHVIRIERETAVLRDGLGVVLVVIRHIIRGGFDIEHELRRVGLRTHLLYLVLSGASRIARVVLDIRYITYLIQCRLYRLAYPVFTHRTEEVSDLLPTGR